MWEVFCSGVLSPVLSADAHSISSLGECKFSAVQRKATDAEEEDTAEWRIVSVSSGE